MPVRAPEIDCVASVDTLLAAVSERTRVSLPIPTIRPGPIYQMPRSSGSGPVCAKTSLLVVDAAYAEFVDRPDYSDGLKFATDTANTLVLRTFSKIHGLAALRCGWGMATRP